MKEENCGALTVTLHKKTFSLFAHIRLMIVFLLYLLLLLFLFSPNIYSE